VVPGTLAGLPFDRCIKPSDLATEGADINVQQLNGRIKFEDFRVQISKVLHVGFIFIYNFVDLLLAETRKFVILRCLRLGLGLELRLQACQKLDGFLHGRHFLFQYTSDRDRTKDAQSQERQPHCGHGVKMLQ